VLPFSRRGSVEPCGSLPGATGLEPATFGASFTPLRMSVARTQGGGKPTVGVLRVAHDVSARARRGMGFDREFRNRRPPANRFSLAAREKGKR
jgi:hypothetical protein